MIIKPPFDFGRQTDFAGIVRIYLPAVLRFDFQLHPDLPAVLNRGNFNRIARASGLRTAASAPAAANARTSGSKQRRKNFFIYFPLRKGTITKL